MRRGRRRRRSSRQHRSNSEGIRFPCCALRAGRPVGFIEPCQPRTGLKPPIGPGGLDQGEEPGDAGGAAGSGRGLGEATMKVKRPGARWEITVEGKPRSYRVDRQIAIELAQYLERKNSNVEVTVRDLEGVEGTVVIPQQPPQVRR